MRRISPNNPVRRRLIFGDDIEDETRVDNFENKLRESIEIEKKEKSKKWGFDFSNEVALNGPYVWHETSDGIWIGSRKSESVKSLDGTKDDDITGMQYNNENTPLHVRNNTVPVMRSRNNNIEQRVIRQSVKRKMDFDDSDFVIRRCCSNS
ncbi:unnamed protein product [Arctia plantaginis]|uniref:Cyclin-dependent kinase inhibitor domain-containing protein n=1 Tax=Arctia plantaginis TaxID=874455 RepID=A0A8S0YZZ1_ARCPL|nr:unnamed protein product [Arctia plantaginis]CAB3238703.1 unnamed protein product [Arctia plantaginis]